MPTRPASYLRPRAFVLTYRRAAPARPAVLPTCTSYVHLPPVLPTCTCTPTYTVLPTYTSYLYILPTGELLLQAYSSATLIAWLKFIERIEDVAERHYLKEHKQRHPSSPLGELARSLKFVI